MNKFILAVSFTIVSSAYLSPSTSSAQVFDDFSDGDFTQAPTWTGSNSKFEVYQDQLHLQALSETSSAYLSTPSVAVSDATWEIQVRMEFNPSSGNYARIYLMADTADLSAPLNGYFVLIGGSADEVSLYRQTGIAIVKIIDGLDKRVNADTVDLKVKVTRDKDGNWELFSDPGNTGEYIPEGNEYDEIHSSSTYFGMYCKYTSTRSALFYFDDIAVTGEPDTDMTPEATDKDVVITEVFADPSPAVELPNAEFIEIYNRSSIPHKLAGWTISDGNATGTLSNKDLLPGHYLILASSSLSDLYTSYGEVMGIKGFPSLNNSGDALVLRSATGTIIDSLAYSDEWYKDTEKKKGGWTLELIDPANICGEQDNWIASEDDSGGTPGRQNSVFANKPDLTGPALQSAFVVSPNVVRLDFNEKLANEDFQLSDFLISPALSIEKVEFTNGSLKGLEIQVDQELETRTLYKITVNNVRDCNRNKIQDENNQTDFAVTEKADSLDVIVNEVLFNPLPGGVDFVEIYNKSAKYIDLINWTTANYDGEIENENRVANTNILLQPGSYKVITVDPDNIIGQWPSASEMNFIASYLPSLPDDEGSIALVDSEGKIIDHFFYSADFHSPLLKDEEGVSLERVSFHAETNNPQNWKSASTTAGYATPGYVNSNARPEGVADDAVFVSPEIFQPVYGNPNFTEINYKFDHGGYVANAWIYDGQGRAIKKLANNDLLAAEGFYRWDGDCDDGSKARIGYYMVWFEVFDTNGSVKTYRKRVVVAGQF